MLYLKDKFGKKEDKMKKTVYILNILTLVGSSEESTSL